MPSAKGLKGHPSCPAERNLVLSTPHFIWHSCCAAPSPRVHEKAWSLNIRQIN